jgi:hypothetical protein
MALAALAMALMAIWQPPLLGAAERRNDAVFGSAVAAYAILRTINATVSTAKETTLGVGLVGSVQTKPAMVLDPIDDTVRRVADVMFIVAAVSGLLVLGMAPVCTFGAAMAALGLAGLHLAWMRPAVAGPWRRSCRSLVAVGLVLGVLLPVGYGAGGWIGHALTEARLADAMDRLQASETSINAATADLTDGDAEPGAARADDPQGETGMLTAMRRFLDGGADVAQEGWSWVSDRAARIATSLDRIAQRGDDTLKSSVDIMAVYTLRLFVFTAMTIFVLYVCARAALSGGPAGRAYR